MYICGCGCEPAIVQMWRSGDEFRPKNQIQVVRLGDKSLYLLSHLTSTLPNTVKAKNVCFKVCSWAWQNGSADKTSVECASGMVNLSPGTHVKVEREPTP